MKLGPNKQREVPAHGTVVAEWTVLGVAPGAYCTMVFCRCACGTEHAVQLRLLLAGRTKRCNDCRRKRLSQATDRVKHGAAPRGGHTPEYRTWAEMHRRCYNPNCRGYPYYGGRGITVCDRWKDSFEAFLEDMGSRPPGRHASGKPLYSIDRINNNGNYEPSNCRWATAKEQTANRRVLRNREIA